jgi:hypothetical protein
VLCFELGISIPGFFIGIGELGIGNWAWDCLWVAIMVGEPAPTLMVKFVGAGSPMNFATHKQS